LNAAKEYGEEPDCVKCPLPQVLRDSERKTEAGDYQVKKILELYQIINQPGITRRGLDTHALEVFSNNLSNTELRTFYLSMLKLDELFVAPPEQKKHGINLRN
jgi:hypothetical protein